MSLVLRVAVSSGRPGATLGGTPWLPGEALGPTESILGLRSFEENPCSRFCRFLLDAAQKGCLTAAGPVGLSRLERCVQDGSVWCDPSVDDTSTAGPGWQEALRPASTEALAPHARRRTGEIEGARVAGVARDSCSRRSGRASADAPRGEAAAEASRRTPHRRPHDHRRAHHASPSHRRTHAGKTSYWDERYTKDPEPFDWYQRYSGIQELVQKYVKKDDAVMMAGCGNSRLSEDMFEDGFANISNVDISRVVIDQMGDKYKDKPALTFQQMNVCSLEFPDESFDAVIVKGTMDAILCGEGSTANVAKMCMEVSRILKPSGVLFVVSYGVPDNRMQYLENEDYSWTVTTHTVPKPTVSATAVPDTKDANSVHYIYVCAKGGNAEEG